MARAAQSPSLFDLADIEDARIEAERARNIYDAAAKAVLGAPIGKKTVRFQAYLEANKKLLRAENHLRRLMREAGL